MTASSTVAFKRKKNTSEDLGDLRSFGHGGSGGGQGRFQLASLNRLRRLTLAKETPLSNKANCVASSSRQD